MLKKSICILALSSIFFSSANAFEIYQYLGWRDIKGVDGVAKTSKESIINIGFFETINIKKMDVIYATFLLTDNKADPQKIKKIAERSKLNPTTPICFDIEIGNGKNADDLPVILDTIRLYREFGGKAPIGVYAVLPQRIVQNNKPLTGVQKKQYIQLNQQYEKLAQQVDFLAPTLYFYSKKNKDNWKSQVALNMAEARKYANKYDLKIYPFIALGVLDKVENNVSYFTPVSEQYMTDALLSLKKQGADGVILWESGATRTTSDNKPAVFDVTKDSFKAVKEFAEKY